MKRNLLLVSMIAAALMTASCSKDDEKNPVEEQQTEQQTQVKQTRPIVIKAGKKSSVSKVATEDGYTLTFSETDKLVLTDGSNTYAELEVDEIAEGGTSATFKGEISTDADGQTIYATIGSALTGVQTSTTSLADVVASNCYLKSAEFEYNANSELSVDLYDQNAYLVFNVADGQKKVELAGAWYTVANKHLYAAIPSGQAISGRFFGTKTAESVEAGKIYTINRTDEIDLGPSFNILWKTENLTLNAPKTATIDGKTFGYYQWYTVNQNYSNGTEHAPNWIQLQALASLAKNGFTTYDGIKCKEFSNEYGAVYLPAAGRYDQNTFYEGQVRGVYWTPNSLNNSDAMGMSFYENNVEVFTGSSSSRHAKTHYFSVRLVRDINN
ncbi:MAG: hypothetical protein II937_05720 [Bacteroidales bacterium]|nr:hypothetical protein [Bacteroidales bacterium]